MLTAGDCLIRVIDFVGADQGGQDVLRKARAVLADAIRDFRGMHRWTWYRTHGRVQVVGPYSTGTVAYSSSTRQLTLSGGIWPTWAASGRVRIGVVIADVATRTSGTVLVLDSTLTFSADISAGSAYVIYQDAYPLPANFQAMNQPYSEEYWGGLCYLTPDRFLDLERMQTWDSTPTWFTIVPSADVPGRYEFKLYPYPDAARTLDFLYLRSSAPVTYDVGRNPGAVTIASASTSLAGAGTEFRSDAVGAVFRSSGDAVSPEAGSRTVFETTVASVQDASTLTLADAPVENLTSVGYSISTKIDVADEAMATAFQWLCKRNMAAELKDKGFQLADQQFNEWFMRAREADARYVGRDRMGSGTETRPAYWWRRSIGADEP